MIAVSLLTFKSDGSGRAGVLNRVAAKLIDLFLVCAVAAIVPYPVGPLIGFLYSILGDGMDFGPFRGQSVGKKLLKLQVLECSTRQPARYKDSLFRNAPVGVATFFAIIPVWGWLILFLIGVPLMLMEIYLMVTAQTGRRLGDVMGDTEVVEVKHDPEESTSYPG
jgi:uncharacterized RDD family membrane protein YckC